MLDENHAEDVEASVEDSLRTLALDHGFRYRDEDPAFAVRWTGPPFGGAAPGGRAVDVVTGLHDDMPVVAFRFLADEPYLVVAAALPGTLPRLSLVPVSDPVDVDPFGHAYEPEDPALADHYELYTVDGETAGAVLHLDAVERLRTHPVVDWRLEGSDLLAISRHTEVSVEELVETFRTLKTIVRGIPNQAFAAYSEPPEYPGRARP